LTLSADNIVSASFDLCFVDSVFTFSAPASSTLRGAKIASTAVLDTCALDDAQFPQGRLVHVEITGDGTSPTLPSGQFLTLAFDSSPDASPGCYPVTLSATLHDTDNHQVTNAGKGVMTVFVFLGQQCPSDCACLSTFCRDGVCCEEDCQGGTCNVPGSEGTCIRP
jgi:hypothetical protein